LPKEVQQRFHYDPATSTQFNAAVQNAIAQSNAKTQQEAKEEAAKAELKFKHGHR
jgi:hypothetical protein